MGLVLIICLIGLSLSKIPAVQSWSAELISQSLTDFLGTTVRIGNVSPGLFNRLIIDDIRVYDQKDSLMLSAARMAAKIRILPLLEKEVHIDNAQLIGADIMLYKDDGGSPLNCQFLIDKFKKDLAAIRCQEYHPHPTQIQSLPSVGQQYRHECQGSLLYA